MEEVLAHAEKILQEAREERAKLQELIAEAHKVAQELLLASRQAKEEIRQSSKHEARKQRQPDGSAGRAVADQGRLIRSPFARTADWPKVVSRENP